jgi:hypothetical protein
MSISAINWALNEVTGITSTQKAILFALADRADIDGCCYPSYDDICSRSCATRNAVSNALKHFESIGLILREKRFSKSTMYRLAISTDFHTAHISTDKRTSSSTVERTSTSTVKRTLTTNEPPKEPSGQKRKRFVPPSIDDVKARCKEMGYTVNAEQFVSFYASKGWMVGKNKMKDWHQALAGWNARNQKPKTGGSFEV